MVRFVAAPSDGREDSEESEDEQERVDAVGDTVNVVATLLLLPANFVLSCKVRMFFRRAPCRFWISNEGDDVGCVLLLLLVLVVGVFGRGISLDTVRERVRKATGEGVEFCCLPLSLVFLSASPYLRFLPLLLLLLCLQ